MDSILTNPVFTVFLTLLSIILAIITISQARRNRRVKRVSAGRIQNIEILNPLIVKENDIKFSHKGNPINGLYQIEFSLVNIGTEFIKITDFHEKPIIRFASDIVIINMSCKSSNDYIKPSMELVNSNELLLDFNVIEKNDKIDVKILYTADHAVKASIHGRIIGGKELYSSSGTEIEDQIYRESKSIGKTIYMLLIALLYGMFSMILNKFLSQSFLEDHTNLVRIGTILPAFIIAYICGHIVKGLIIDKKIRKLVRDGIVDPESLSEYFKSRLPST